MLPDGGRTRNRLRVLHIGKFYPPVRGGIESHVAVQAEALREHVELKVIVANKTRLISREILNGVSVTRLPTWMNLAGAPICPAMVREIRAFRPDIVHLHLPNPPAVLAYLASGHSGGLICSYHSDVVRQKFMSRVFQPILYKLLNRADAIIVSSRNYLQSSAVLRSFEERCRVIPLGISLKKLPQANEFEVRAIRKRFGPRIILAVGRLVYYKGFEYLIRAMSKVDATLVLIGSGGLQHMLSNEIRERGLEGKVHLLGDVEDEALTNYYTAADLFVLPSVERSEAFGLVQLEAMACGTPVINTSLDSGVPFVSENGVTGITVPPRDSDALATAIQFLLENDELRAVYGEAARRRVHERFTIETQTDALLELYGLVNPQFASLTKVRRTVVR
jgi:glycosyltransferase involved in cell wall biosynthesis